MLYYEKINLIFIHNPKTAGTSIRSYLDTNFGVPKLLGEHHNGIWEHDISNELKNGARTFGVVRNPWDRIYSLWKMYVRNGYIVSEFDWYKQYVVRIFNGDAYFVYKNVHCFEDLIIKCSPLIKTQCSFFHNDKLNVDYICKFENLARDFTNMCSNFNIPSKSSLPQLNISPGKDYKSCYNDKNILLVADIFKEDILRYNYSF